MKPIRLILLALMVCAPLACDSGSKKGGGSPSPMPNGPNNTTFDLTSLKADWAVTTGRRDAFGCTAHYDFTEYPKLFVHILCLGNKRSVIQMESAEYTLNPQGPGTKTSAGFQATRQPTKCQTSASPTKTSLRLLLEKGNLVLSEGQSILSLSKVPQESLEADLKTAKTLHKLPIVRGCFNGPNLTSFEAKE